MKQSLAVALSTVALLALSSPARAAQSGMSMPMTMPMPGKKKPPARKAAPVKKAANGPRPVSAMPAPRIAAPQIDQSTMQPGAMPMEMPMLAAPAPASAHSSMDMSTGAPGGAPAGAPMAGMDMSHGGMAGMDHMTMAGALGPYGGTREASGTAWQPDNSDHMGVMTAAGGWMLMGHGVLNLVADHQSGRRGADKLFASGMLMGMAQRPLGHGMLQFKAMVSPDPLMGPRGYPLLLATGETANGRDRLIDRQHPHDLFMELSVLVSQDIGPRSSAFLYAALPGEPAFGPPAFMHREAIMDSPEAPISHHWLDSTHISFGVLTGGVVLDQVKLEVSRFNAREPDQHRYNIETGPLDSTAVRMSWNPTRSLSLQGSWGYFVDPEQLEPGVNQRRWSASVLYARDIAPGWKLAGTLAWGRKSIHGHDDDAYALEASLRHGGWTTFGRAETIQNRELVNVPDGPAYRVSKASLGAVRDFKIAERLAFGVGGLVAVNAVPAALAPLYGGRHPLGTMGFVRLKVD